jgi:hypothetical protein
MHNLKIIELYAGCIESFGVAFHEIYTLTQMSADYEKFGYRHVLMKTCMVSDELDEELGN